MARAPIGQRIRKRRQELGRSQSELAASVGISASYLNLIEHNKRPIGGALLNRIGEAIQLDSRALAGTEEARLIAELSEMAADAVGLGIELEPDEAGELVANSPGAARTILDLYRAYREVRLRSDLLGERLGEDTFLAEASNQVLALITTIRSYAEILKDYGDLSDAERRGFVATLVDESERLAASAGNMFDFMSGRGAGRPRPSPREAIEDFVSDHANYFPRLEAAAEETLKRIPGGKPTLEALSDYLTRRFRMTVERRPPSELPISGEAIAGRVAYFSEALPRSTVAFRVARLIGRLAFATELERLVASAMLDSEDAASRLDKALANYFAGALTMTYEPFLSAAEELRFDVTRLCHRFDASFEQVCHRLTTLRRAGAEGVPLHFLRTDIAGNISKRFSASGLRLPRYGGACPRWIVHHAFATPGRVVTQFGQLANGETYFFVARANVPEGAGVTESQHAVMIGCALSQAHRFAYTDGIDLSAPPNVVPIGITCRQCPRDCAQRAFDRIAIAPSGASAAVT